MAHLNTSFSSNTKFNMINQIPCSLFLEKNSILNYSNNPCEICKKYDPIFLLTCGRCGLVVHNYCYDIEIFKEPWICQSCY